jgi:hypothetical protein
MKRRLLAASALVLALVGCGAGHHTSAPRLANAATHVSHLSVRQIVARHEVVAASVAAKLLQTFVPPADARLTTHGPSGYRLESSGVSPRRPFSQELGFFQTKNGLATRLLNVGVVALPTRTIVRVDAKVTWAYPRSPEEKLPAGIRTIAVSAPKISRVVTAPSEVHELVHWFDALPITPPGVSAPCGPTLGPSLTLRFLSATGDQVAEARAPKGTASVCDAIEFTIRGRQQTPLIDSPNGRTFVDRVQRLLGVKLSR